MSQTTRILYFFVLPIVAMLLYPPSMLISGGGIGVLIFVLALFILLGVLLWRGRTLALTFSIFMQGFNVIIRLMMFFANIYSVQSSQVDFAYLITAVLSIGLSMYLLLRLDQSDVRVQMVS